VGKWYIANINNTPVPSASAYSIVFGDGTSNTNGNTTGGGCNCDIPTALPPNGAAGGDLSGTYPNPIVKGIQGRPVLNTQPSIGDVLKWDGNLWVPSAETTVAAAPTNTTPKTSVLYFNQAVDLVMQDPNINTLTIPGLENRSFTVAQNSHVIFNTVIPVLNFHPILTELEMKPVGVWLTVEILNSSNQMVARSVSEATITFERAPTIVSVGLGILSAGNYHTHVTISRELGGYQITVLSGPGVSSYHYNQSQMILEIIPD
jgi:hypothetical protein